MTSQEFDKPFSPQERLTAAKAAFRGSVLQNDTLFDVLRTRLSEPGSVDATLPDFGLEPTLRRNDDGTSTIGLRVNRSATASGDVISTYIGVYDYLPLGQMDTSTGRTRVTPELETALIAIGEEKAAALGIWQAWQAAVSEIGIQFPEPLVLDPMTDTFELEADVMARSFVAQPE